MKKYMVWILYEYNEKDTLWFHTLQEARARLKEKLQQDIDDAKYMNHETFIRNSCILEYVEGFE